MEKIRHGRLRLDRRRVRPQLGRTVPTGPFDGDPAGAQPALLFRVAFAGTVGAGEAYINGYWQCDDLTDLVRLFVVNRDSWTTWIPGGRG